MEGRDTFARRHIGPGAVEEQSMIDVVGTEVRWLVAARGLRRPHVQVGRGASPRVLGPSRDALW